MKDIPFLVKLLLDAVVVALGALMLWGSISTAHAACGGFDLMLDVYADGHHSVVINPDFVTHDACVRAGIAASARWAHLGEKVDFVCVSHK